MDELSRRHGWCVVVVSFNSSAFLDGCLRALFACHRPPDEVVVVDNGSTDDSLQELAAWPQVLVEQSRTNLGFAGGANRGVDLTEAPIVLLLNPDVEVDRDFGDTVVAVFDATPKLGAAGPKLRYPDSDLLQHAGGKLIWPRLTTAHRGYREPDGPAWNVPADVDFVTGGAMALRRTAFIQVQGFDDFFWPAYYEDVDLCQRLRQRGWQVRYQPELTATHVESVTLGQSLDYYRYFQRNRLRFALKHLSDEGWWARFIPAEIERLRGDLSAIRGAEWPITSGGTAIEELARINSWPLAPEPSLLDGAPLAAMVEALAEVRSRREIIPPPDAVGGSSWRAWLARRLLGRQQVFNDAVTRALEAQDRVNRELTAQLLLALLDLSWREARRV